MNRPICVLTIIVMMAIIGLHSSGVVFFEYDKVYEQDGTSMNFQGLVIGKKSETDYKIYKLLDRVISYGKYYSVTEMEEIIDFYTMVGKIDFEMAEILLSKLSKE